MAETPISSATSHFYTVPLRSENCPEAASQIPPSNTNSFSNTENATLTHWPFPLIRSVHHSPKPISYLEAHSSNPRSCQQVPHFLFPLKILFCILSQDTEMPFKKCSPIQTENVQVCTPPIEQIRDRSALKGNAWVYLNILFYLSNYLDFLSRSSDFTGSPHILVSFSFTYVITLVLTS